MNQVYIYGECIFVVLLFSLFFLSDKMRRGREKKINIGINRTMWPNFDENKTKNVSHKSKTCQLQNKDNNTKRTKKKAKRKTRKKLQKQNQE